MKLALIGRDVPIFGKVNFRVVSDKNSGIHASRISRAVLCLLVSLFFVSSAHLGEEFPQREKSVPLRGGLLRVRSYAAEFNQVFDPAAAPHYFIVEQLFDGLVKLDSNFTPLPALAEYWTKSEDDRTTIFYLKKGVLFHNGEELTAEDVKFSLERLVQNRPDNACYQYFTAKVVGAQEYWEGQADEVRGFKVLDDHTFAVEWMKPGVSGLYLLGMYYCKVLPKDLLSRQGRRFFQNPVGTGPFMFSRWVRTPRLDIVGVRLERNPAYFGKKAFLNAIEYSPHFSEDQFEEGQVHITAPTSAALLRKDRYRILENSSLRSAFLAMSCHIPPLNRAEFRRALSLGIDKKMLAEAASSTAQAAIPTANYIPHVLPGFFPRAASPLYNPEEAKSLLDRLLEETGREKLRLILYLLEPRRDMYSDFFGELEKQMALLDIDLDVRYVRNLEELRGVRDPYLVFLEWEMDYPDAENIIMPLFASRSRISQAVSHYENPDLDDLLAQSEEEQSWEKRTTLFRRMEKLLFEDVPAIPLYDVKLRVSLLPKVRGAELPALGFFFLDMKKIWLEE